MSKPLTWENAHGLIWFRPTHDKLEAVPPKVIEDLRGAVEWFNGFEIHGRLFADGVKECDKCGFLLSMGFVDKNDKGWLCHRCLMGEAFGAILDKEKEVLK